MFNRGWWAVAIVVSLSFPPALAAKDPDQKLWAAVRKGNLTKLERFLAEGVDPESRLVALSISVSGNQQRSFSVLWTQDNSDISSDALDYSLCYAYRVAEPAALIQQILDERVLTIERCCERNRQQPYCAQRAVMLTDRKFPETDCRTIFIEEGEVPPGATRIAVLWDERTSVLEQASTARYGPKELSKIGARDWARKFASTLGALGADAILITHAGTDVASASSLTHFPGRKGDSALTGFTFGTVIDRIEIVGIRTVQQD